jgi:exosortase/archaeosortase family protein
MNMRNRIIIWLVGCLAIAIASFGELWSKLIDWLSPEGLQVHGVFHWGVLGLCLLWLWLKRKDILPRMQHAGLNPVLMLIGILLLALSLFLPRNDDFLILLMLIGWLGLFVILFKKASLIPSILLAIYGFSVAFPIAMLEWFGEASATATTNVVTTIFKIVGLPITSEGTLLFFNSTSGDTISTVITPECAGYTTIGVFVALFALMMLDIRLPLRKAWYVFLFGLAGTWLQNIVRIVITVIAGYFWGSDALESTHYNISYIIFPIWFGLFAYLYLKVARRN